jgi:hypothetical protein
MVLLASGRKEERKRGRLLTRDVFILKGHFMFEFR